MNKILPVFQTLKAVSSQDLVIGKCYLIKYQLNIYRAIFTAAIDDTRGMFDFCDYELMRACSISDVRHPPSLAELQIPYQVTWAYTDVSVAFHK